MKILPSVLPMGAQTGRIDLPEPFEPLTETVLQVRKVDRDTLMCANGRSVLKHEGKDRVYPCPIIYEVPDFDLGGSLKDSFGKAVTLTHTGCATYCCRAEGRGTCANA